jgi:phosphatidylserine/phosphatidylglycerophosphate/cardiolipin synthase-like enzyme
VDRTRLAEALSATLADTRVSRGERGALRELLREHAPQASDRTWLRHRAFALAAERLSGPGSQGVLTWLEDITGLLQPPETTAPTAQAFFSPGHACVRRITSLLASSSRSVDICVFALSDDRISREIQAAHERGVEVRLLTDDAKATDRGADVERLSAAGIRVAVDNSPAHMHHKFALFDHIWLLTGSYNWTRAAARENSENILVTNDTAVVRRFREEFERLWQRYAS